MTGIVGLGLMTGIEGTEKVVGITTLDCGDKDYYWECGIEKRIRVKASGLDIRPTLRRI